MKHSEASPVAVIRSAFECFDAFREWSTQAGFAKFIGRSESLIRAVEGGRVDMSLKLAMLISGKTGASIAWLMNKTVPVTGIPTEVGRKLVFDPSNHIPALEESGGTAAQDGAHFDPFIRESRETLKSPEGRKLFAKNRVSAPARKAAKPGEQPARSETPFLDEKRRQMWFVKRMISREIKGLSAAELSEFAFELHVFLQDRKSRGAAASGHNDIDPGMNDWMDEEMDDEDGGEEEMSGEGVGERANGDIDPNSNGESSDP